MEKVISIQGITISQLEINICQIYLRFIMISDLSNTNGTAIPPGRMMGQWRKESKLTWPEIPKPLPKAWETFRRVIMKIFGILRRVYNPCAEVPLITKLGKWLDNERHSAHKMICDINNMYFQEKNTWKKFKWIGKEGQY